MDPSLEIVAKLNDILPNPGCVYEALESILESCQTPERLEERTWLGIKLSICEFQAARVNFPAICSDERSLSTCTQLLETKATWWTTFSGNYRHISAICLEYQPHFESQRVLGTFKNASKLFAQYQTEIDQALSDFQRAKADSVQNWQQQAEELSGELAKVVLELSNIDQLLRNSSQDAVDMFIPLTSVIDTTETKLQQAVVSSQFLMDQAIQVSRRVATFNCVMADVESRHIHASERLQTTVNFTISSLDTEIRSLQGILGSLKKALGIFGLLIRFFWPILAAIFIFFSLSFLTRFIRKMKHDEHDEIKHTSSDEYDLVFY